MKRTISWFSVLPGLVIPVCLGLVFYIGLKAAIHHAWITDETTLRYLTGHPIAEISVAMFFVGWASLMLISLNVFQQVRYADWIQLDPAPNPSGLTDAETDEISTGERAAKLAKKLAQTDSGFRGHYLFQRLESALQSIYQNGSASHVEEELKHLADLDAEQQQQSYSLVQILIWATPMLGFLGTVLGISQALGGISVGPDNDFQQMMDGLKASLYVAFDTTALALTLSMVLMFGQFLVDRFESQLLRMVEHRAHAEIASQFDLSGDAAQVSGNSLESNLIATMEAATERQTELWRESLHWAGSTLTQAIQDSHSKFESNLEATIGHSLQSLAFNLGESISRADQSMSHRWEQWQVLLSENTRHVAKNQTSFVEQTQAVCRMLDQTAQQTSQSSREMAEQFRLQIGEVSEKLQSVSSELRSDSFVAKLGELLTIRSTDNPGLDSENSDFESCETGNQHLVVEGQWISVPPTFLMGDESSDGDAEQVILPVTTAMKREIKLISEDDLTDGGDQRAHEPEVILPFLKKSA